MYRRNHYLAQGGYTLDQLLMFERERIAVIVLCTLKSQNMTTIGELVGHYQARRIVNELLEDKYLIRVRGSKTAEIRYKVNTEAINKTAFFMMR